jgi:conjugative relaxase-like TrwC/TraI family protein
MQTTHKIAGKDAGAYSNYLTSDSRGDYYLDGEEQDSEDENATRGASSEWHGSATALASLGLTPGEPVQRDQLLALMNGQAPNDGREIRVAGGNGTKVAGIDLTFSAPKDVSALWAASSGAQREQIEQAHKDAVASAIAHVEKNVESVRTREAGQLKWQTPNSLVAAKFTHTSSRLTAEGKNGVPDPQLHTHVVVLAAERENGRFAAVDSRQMFLSARENGAFYRSELASNLQAHGLQIERGTGKDGRYFGIVGVPSSLSEQWSARTAQIDKAAREFKAQYGRDPKAGELGSLTVSTRGGKTELTASQVDAAWKAVAAEHGLTNDATQQLWSAPENGVALGPAPDLAREILEKVSDKRSMVSERELYAIAYERSAGVCPPSEAKALVGELERSGQLVALQGGMWTTKELREREQQTVATVKDRANENAAPVSPQSLAQAQRDIGREIGGALSSEQRDAVHSITGEGGVSALIGQAGTGKGVVLHSATDAWQKDGYTVIGTAIAGATAERLGADAKTDRSMTTDALLLRAEKGTLSLDKDTVVVMDEAGMADTGRLSQLVELTAQKDSKLVLAGDAAQLSPIGAGGLFAQVTEHAPTAELKEVHRAENQWERDAWAQVREGNATMALAQYEAHDRLTLTDTREQAIEQMLADWNDQRLEQPEGRTVMLTDASNAELDQINTKAQELRDNAGELGNDRASVPDSPYQLAAGDQVIFTKALYQPGGKDRVENGTLGTVKDVHDKENVTIDTHGANQREVNVNTHEFKDIRLGYAQHVYTAQGLTADKALALIGGWQTDRERAYVALTRGREQTNIYTSRENLGQQGLNQQAIERLAERINQSNAQEASISRDTTNDRTIDTGVGADRQIGPAPSTTMQDRQTPALSREPQPERDAPATEQQSLEEDRDQALGVEIG